MISVAIRSCLLVAVLAVTTFVSSKDAEARSWRVDQFPRGAQLSCLGCHLNANGSGLNDFGFDSANFVTNANLTWNAEFAARDSDRDGFSNGFELGDPNGTWRIGDANPTGTYWNPSDRDDSPCGNGQIDGPEECDGTNFPNGRMCSALGLGAGTVSCNDKCEIVTELCGSCGDGILNPNFEECEGTDLQGATCQDVGYDEGGTLGCEADGCEYDTTGCLGSGPEGNCGDGTLQSSEQCDGDNFGGNTCALLGYDGGRLNCFQDCTLDFIDCFGGEDPPEGPETGGENGGEGPENGAENPPSEGSTINATGSCSTTPIAPGATQFGFWIVFVIAIRRRRN